MGDGVRDEADLAAEELVLDSAELASLVAAASDPEALAAHDAASTAVSDVASADADMRARTGM